MHSTGTVIQRSGRSLFYAHDSSEQSLQREVESGNVEYKLKLVEPTETRFQQLVTQLKWRLAEGAGKALYEMGVGDDGTLAGLGEHDMAASLDTLRRMCVTLNARCASSPENASSVPPMPSSLGRVARGARARLGATGAPSPRAAASTAAATRARAAGWMC